MGIRIQPRDIEIPEDDPFKNDLLGRKEPVEVLTHLIGSIEGPCVLAVDAAWGAGKTTFLRIWAQYLRNKSFPVVEFNAWETDFTGDPFIALSDELMSGLRQYTDEPLAGKINAAKDAAKEVFRRALPSVIRLATAGILDVSPMLEKEAGQALASYAEERLSSYRKEQESVQAFRAALQDMASALAKSKEGRPLVVVIDELDRCRPSYATELLEVAKHLFTVDHIVFVLAVNRSELAHSIRALYGSEFDAQGYLRRFFDVDFLLPDLGRKSFIETTLEAIQLNDYFERTKDRMARPEYETVKTLLLAFFDAPDLSLRRIAQAIHRLGLVFASLRSDQRSFAMTAVVALILRTVDSDLYHRFVRREASDRQVVDKMFNRPGARTLQQQHAGHLFEFEPTIEFEATIIVAAQEAELVHSMMRSEPINSINSPLLQRYQDLVDADQSDNASPSPERERAGEVIRLVQALRKEVRPHTGDFGFRHSVQRIELLSAGLIDEPTTEHESS